MNPTAKAALWMIGAICAFTSMAIAGRVISAELNTFEIMLYRSLIGLCIMVSIIGATGNVGHFSTRQKQLHLLRNICHFAGQNLWFFALTMIPLAQVFALEFTTPIWVILLSPLILQERLTTIAVLSAVLGFLGILLVARPDISNINLGVLAGAGCAVGFALTAIFTRKLTRGDSILTILFYLTVTQAVFGLICAAYAGGGQIAVPSSDGWIWVAVIAIAGLVAHFCLTTALSIAPAATVMPIDFVRLPVIAVVGMLLYDESLDLLVFVGAAIIFAANYLNITRGQEKRPE